MERFASRYSPAVLLVGVAVAVVGGLSGGDWDTWLERAATVIVAAAPCALVISIPMTYVAAIATPAATASSSRAASSSKTLLP